MEEQKNKINPAPGQNNKADEERELLKEAKILVRDQKGKFEYLEGKSLFGSQQSTAIKQVTASEVRPALLELKRPSDKVTATFYFDREDEEEVRKVHEEKIGDGTPLINYNDLVQEISIASGISFSDELLQKRFVSLITSRLRDIRTSLQLKELLTRSQKVGGLELSLEQADLVIALTEEKAKTIHDHKTIEELEEREKKREEEEIKEAQKQAKIRQAVAREQIKKALQALNQKNREKQEIKVTPQPAPEKKPEVIPPIPIIPKVKRPPQDILGKPKIVDIKTPPKTLGPVEEIKSLNLHDFRRLSATPQEAIEKVKEKIELLEEESITEKARGIKAWQQSEIYQLYLDIGNESMNKGISVKEVIASRTMEGRSYLTEEEFKAVGDLNKNLRF